ncbi:MAG TPA: cytochrome c [Hanamia sp.]|nr:cytochrome c [Hanamia sp.]
MAKRKILKTTAVIIVSLIVVTLATIYTWSTILLNKTYSIPITAVHIPNDSASIIEGERLIHIAHCGDCHGEHFTGAIFPDVDPKIATMVAPNLTHVIPTYSNEEIERLLRYGVKKNGHSIYIMPAFMYHELKEESVSKIIAYLRTLKPEPNTPGLPEKSFFNFKGRISLIQDAFSMQGELSPIAGMIQPNTEGKYIHHDTTQVSFGRYLAMSTCTSCHGTDLKGFEGFSPNLIIAASYKREDFFKLIRTGVALGDRKNIGLMSQVTKNYLSYLNDHEIECIYAYLQTKPTQATTKK